MSPTLSQLDTLIHMTSWMANQKDVLMLARAHIVALETELYYYCGDHPDPMDEGKRYTNEGFRYAPIWHGRTIASRKLLGLPGFGPDPTAAGRAHPYNDLGPINSTMTGPVDQGFGYVAQQLEQAMADR